MMHVPGTVSTYNAAVLRRLADAIDGFDRGESDVEAMQAQLAQAMTLIERSGDDVVARIHAAEADLERIRFTVPDAEQHAAVQNELISPRARIAELLHGCDGDV